MGCLPVLMNDPWLILEEKLCCARLPTKLKLVEQAANIYTGPKSIFEKRLVGQLIHYAAFQRQTPGGERVACGEDRRHALGSTKKEGLEVGSSLGTQGSGRVGRMKLSNGCSLQTKAIAAIKRHFFLCADVGLMATTPLARKRRDAGNQLERRGEHSSKPGEYSNKCNFYV